MPQLNTEDERTAAGIIVEDRLDRRIGKDAAIPVEFAIGVDRRKRRRQRSGRHDLLDSYSGPTAVKIMHHAGPDISGTDSQPRLPSVDDRAVHQLSQCFAERLRRVESSAMYPQ